MLNRCEFIGNLGADPEVRNLPSGGKVVNLRLAVSEHWRDKNTGERKERTEWVSVVIFSEGLVKVAEQYLHKGSKVYLAGSMQTRRWQDQSGNDKYSTEIVLQGFNSVLTMLDGPSRSDEPEQPARGSYSADKTKRQAPATAFSAGLDDSEIPF